MTPFTGSAIMGATAGIMSLFSSGLGVVFPTLLPTVSSVAETVGGLNPIELGSLVVIGGTITGLSPVSTTGGMIMALQDNQEKEQKIFLSLVFWGLAALVLVFVLALVGVYRVAL
jgi:Mg2+/citrate symporter